MSEAISLCYEKYYIKNSIDNIIKYRDENCNFILGIPARQGEGKTSLLFWFLSKYLSKTENAILHLISGGDVTQYKKFIFSNRILKLDNTTNINTKKDLIREYLDRISKIVKSKREKNEKLNDVTIIIDDLPIDKKVFEIFNSYVAVYRYLKINFIFIFHDLIAMDPNLRGAINLYLFRKFHSMEKVLQNKKFSNEFKTFEEHIIPHNRNIWFLWDSKKYEIKILIYNKYFFKNNFTQDKNGIYLYSGKEYKYMQILPKRVHDFLELKKKERLTDMSRAVESSKECSNKECSNKENSNKEYSNQECSNKEYLNKECSNKKYSNKECSNKKYSNKKYLNKENSDEEYSDEEYSNKEYSNKEYSNQENSYLDSENSSCSDDDSSDSSEEENIMSGCLEKWNARNMPDNNVSYNMKYNNMSYYNMSYNPSYKSDDKSDDSSDDKTRNMSYQSDSELKR